MSTIFFTVTTDLTYDQRMQRICSSLSNAGFNIVIIGRELPNSIPLFKKKYSQHRLKCFFNKGKLFYLEFNLRLFLYMVSKKSDAVCSIDLDTALAGLFISKIKKKYYILDLHEYFPETPEVTARLFIKKIWQWVEAATVPRAHLVYTVSEALADIFEKKYNVKVHTIRNMSLPGQHKVSHTPGEYLLYTGAVNEGRGLEPLIKCLPSFPNLRLLICGDGDIMNRIQSLIEELSLKDRVQLLGKKTPARLMELQQNAWAGINLLENKGLSYYYSLANKFFDYVQAGVPQICADFPEYKALNGVHNVAVLSSIEEKSIKKAIRKLQDSTYYSKLKNNTRPAAQEWNWGRESEKIINLYNTLLRN